MKLTSPLLNKEAKTKWYRWPSWIGYAAMLWSVLYGALHLYWLWGGAGYPFNNDGMGLFAAMVTYLPAKVGSIVFVTLCLMGIGIGLVMQKTQNMAFSRWFAIAYSWGFSVALLLFIPDTKLIAAMAYAFLFKFDFNWQMLNQIICIIGALFWMMAAVVYQRKTRHACEYCGRTDDGETPALIRWGRWLTIIAVFAPIPYAFIRFSWALDIPLGVDPQFLRDFSSANPMAHMTEWVFGSVCIVGGILTLGLIQKWGEVFPRWFPFIGGKRVPIMLAVIPASIVAIAVTAAGFVFTFGIFAMALQLVPMDNILLSQGWGAMGPMIFWVPWGVALGLAAIAYYYRRRGRCSNCGKD
ncbi:hypothetical protein BACCIP111895_04243 [Neobacillus rhizosphaerae]|uniref:DUF3995 domain-containing protein n=1 Tax=Neobacillus rhizosphaerae TaxID=2880965 RepID=A0ABM9EWN9_9BACI|nr:hypothetical protein [Neobacillus rhizosphaerae]CAH2717054.1 hypothetical protein BACCIP111895_04243 [Neobacillus rhizosphaerae]